MDLPKELERLPKALAIRLVELDKRSRLGQRDKRRVAVTARWRDFYGSRCPRQWRFQERVVQRMMAYLRLASYLRRIRPKERLEAAVVKMPTGTGKTAIMALLANYAPSIETTLIVVPSEALKSQVRDYISAAHWIVAKHRPEQLRIARVFVPSNLSDFLRDLEREGPYRVRIGVCTTKALGDLHASDGRDGYNRLKEAIDLVIVDEGHREPAKTWSRAVRKLEKPVVLFTATPYRNDLRFFNIGKAPRSEVTYHEASGAHKCIRSVEFVQNVLPYTEYSTDKSRWVPTRSDGAPQDYLDSLQVVVQEVLATCKEGEPKVIIRCESEASIRRLTDALNSDEFNPEDWGLNRFMNDSNGVRRQIAIGIHDSYSINSTHHRYERVSSIFKLGNADQHAIFWIHQNKLAEGIDESDFILVSFYEPFGNARSLVQQIGRIIRKPVRSQQTVCYVHADSTYELEGLWQGYLDYEDVDEAGKKQRIYGTEEIVKRIVSAFPNHFYFSNRFAKMLSADLGPEEMEEILKRDLRLPRATTVFRGDADKSSIDQWLNSLSDWLMDQDIIKLKTGVQSLRQLWPSLGVDGFLGAYLGFQIKPTEYLSTHLFFDISMVTCTFLTFNKLVFFRGNSISWLGDIKQEKQLTRLSGRDVQKLAEAAGGDLLIKQASFVHSDPGPYSKRRRVEGGRDLIQTAPFIDDHLHAMTSLVCSRDRLQRYLGLARSRVTDGRGAFVSTEAYVDWARQIEAQLNHEVAQNNYFGRFAAPIDAPRESDVDVWHMLCDFHLLDTFLDGQKEMGDGQLSEAFEEEEITFHGNWKDHDIELTRYHVEGEPSILFRLVYQNGKFALRPKSKQHEDRLAEHFGAGIGRELSRRLILRILVACGGRDYFYTDGQFFDPSIPLWGNKRLEALGILYGIEALEVTEFEKEPAREKTESKKDFQERLRTVWGDQPESWPESSIFRLADDLRDQGRVNALNDSLATKDRPFFVPDVMICPDQSGEIADFILYRNASAENSPKLVVIHAKQASPPFAESAVGFAKIQEQIIKNLRLFDTVGLLNGELERNVKGRWTGQLKRKLALSRIRPPVDKTPGEIVTEIADLVRRGAPREVWVFYGQGFRCGRFLEELEDPSLNRYWFRHLAYLLVNVNSAADRARATLRVFTSR